MANTVTFKIKIDDSGSFKKITVDSEEFGAALNSVRNQARDLNDELINAASRSQVFKALNEAVNGLSSALGSLAASYYEDEVSSRKLATAMANTMGATEDEVSAVKDLIDAQEKMGVISAGVQTAASQELATYLEYSDTLKTLIPVLNDMAAQQYGVGASAESVTQIASMLGKVMNGQTEALSRYGYKFDEAQKQVLKFGTEEERAATLAEVVSQSVGGMNRELAKTSAGKMQQLGNSIEKIKSAFGSIVKDVAPVAQGISNVSGAITGVMNAYKGIEALGGSTGRFTSQIKLLGTGMVELVSKGEISKRTLVSLRKVYGDLTTATRAMRLAALGLAGVLAGALVAAVTAIIKKHKEQKEAAQQAAMEEKSAMDNINDTVASSISGQMRSYRELQSEWNKLGDSLEGKRKFIIDNQSAFEALGVKVGSVSEAESLFVGNEAAFIASLQNRAMAAAAMDLAAEKYKESIAKMMEAEQYKPSDEQEKQARKVASDAYIKALSGRDVIGRGQVSGKKEEIMAKAYSDAIKSAVADATKAIRAEGERLQEEGDRYFKIGEDAGKKYKEGMAAAGFKEFSPLGGVGDSGMAADIKNYRESIQRALEVNKVFNAGQDEISVQLKTMQSGITALIQKYGLESSAVKDLVREYRELQNVRLGMNEPLPKLDSSILTGKAFPLNADDIKAPEKEIKKLKKEVESVGDSESVISTLAGAFGSLGEVVSGAAGSWLEWIGNLLRAVAQAVPAIVTLTAAIGAKTTAETADAAAGAASSVAPIPIVGPGLAVAAAATIVASILAVISSIPKFASGAIAYGPTLGLFGEYPGASNNPEVVTPLSNLKGLLGDFIGMDNSGAKVLEFRIRGRDLRTILMNEENLKNRG